MKEKIKSILIKINILEKIKYLLYLLKKIKITLTSDKKYFEKIYENKFQKKLNLANPKTFNEKVIKRILFNKNLKYTQLTDKYLVRDYVKEKIGEKYLIKLYGIYKNVDEIEYENFPKEFVLKCNHDSGSVFICKDKEEFDLKRVKQELKFYLKRNFYYVTREWHYKNIKPLIICEEKLKDITDYKFHCFSGKVNHVEVIFNRFNDKRFNLYDRNWKLLPYKISGCKNTDSNIEKPQNFEKMLKIAEKLSKEFNYCRIDLYNNKGEIKFGEITFTPASGLDELPEELDLYLGSLWKE